MGDGPFGLRIPKVNWDLSGIVAHPWNLFAYSFVVATALILRGITHKTVGRGRVPALSRL